MSNESKTVDAKDRSLGDLFTDVDGFYIPNYQRPYTWTEEDIERLFETIKTAIQKNIKDQDYFAFLGAILAIDSSEELRKVYGINKDDSPTRVLALIDGQQRITSLILLIGELYKQLEGLKLEIHQKHLDIGTDYLDKLQTAINNAKLALFAKDQSIDEDDISNKHNKYFPKLINGYFGDEWKSKGRGKYSSPISVYLQDLAKNNKAVCRDKNIVKLTDKFRKLILKFIEEPKTEDLLSKILDNNGIQQKLLYKEIPSTIKNYLDGENVEKKDLMKKFIIFLVLSKFIRENIFFARITVNREDFAFDIFDSLNSTGDPLTAIETFRPKVISDFKNQNESYEGSDENNFLDNFTNYLSKKKENRHELTKNFIITLALYENGQIVSKNLNEQRKYLQKTYDDYNSNEKTNLCESISLVTDFYSQIWDIEDIESLSGLYSGEAKLCLSILRDMKHTITIPILSRYYTELILNRSQNPEYKKYSKIIQCITTFSLFWRLLHSGSTAGIDDIYRKLLDDEISRYDRKKNLVRGDLLQFDLIKYFQDTIETKFKGFDENVFIQQICGARYSEEGKNSWIKFFILAALHDSIPDGTTGLDKKGIKDSHKTLNVEKWKSLQQLTVEHIAPQSPEKDSDWDKDLIHPVNLHSIGNLTLLTQQINKIAGNKNWQYKKNLYTILVNKDPKSRLDDLETLFGTSLSKNAKNIISNSSYWSFVESLSLCEQSWLPSLVQERAKRLSERVWDNLSPWLGYPKVPKSTPQ
jgi:hypothetical protein